MNDRQGRPDFLKPAFFSLFDLAEFLGSIRIRFEMTLKVEVVLVAGEVRQRLRISSAAPQCGNDIHRGRKCQAGFRFESR